MDPKASLFAPGTPEREACDEFNIAYTDLLRMLDDVFNGQPAKIQAAKAAMNRLGDIASLMASGMKVPGKFIGPSFEFSDTRS